MWLLLTIGCDLGGKVELGTCEEIESAYAAELASIQSCTLNSECGQPLTGTSCGCTRDLVARTDADTTEFYTLLDKLSEEECELVGSTCDCPEADGYICDEGVCAWNYITEFEALPACDGDAGDPFDLNSVSVAGDLLAASVSYGGGCETHDWTLCWPDQAFAESDPVQASLEILHDANDDACDAWLTEDIYFGLTPLQQSWQAAYGETSGTIILNVGGESLTYSF